MMTSVDGRIVVRGWPLSAEARRQYDRTATLWLGGVNLYFGTTQEPSATVSPHWHVERDLTDYSALLRQSGQGTGSNRAGRAFECVHGALGFVVLPGGQGRARGLYGMCLPRHKLAQQALVRGAFVQHAPQAGGHVQPWDVAQCVIGRRRGGGGDRRSFLRQGHGAELRQSR